MGKQTELQVNGGEVATLPPDFHSAWGAGEELDATDLVLPRLLICQKQSKVLEEPDSTVSPGDIYDSLSLKTVPQPVEVIIFHVAKVWKETAGKRYVEYPLTGENANLPEEEEVDGETVQRSRAYNYYALLSLAGELSPIPYVVSFDGWFNWKVGNRLNSVIAMLKAQRKPSAAIAFELKTTLKKNDKGSWFIYGFDAGRETTQAEQLAAHNWRQTILQSLPRNHVTVHVPDERDFNEDDIPF